MKLTKLTPVLYTNDLKKSVDFYVEILNFSSSSLDVDSTIAFVRFGDIELMLSLPNDHVPFTQSNFTGSFYFQTLNVMEIWESIKDKASICYPIEDFEYGLREFAIYDNNGYLFRLDRNYRYFS
ncbi:VOC family protein [Sphingobacterium hungaricum]|uniref:Bleomycin resistance family protein n=1 Tax=Sphingobacterium hungaricum TaxID=2082723 RepID=A0A928YPK7_9SPHI|nr:VOC family protein [Sphingobacterium hungaricum]MBE8712617.1 bleomycin resistance family protein [Sphingobacterium hungaricum]